MVNSGFLGDSKKGVVIIDDHKIVRDGMKAMLMVHPHFAVIGEADNAAEGYQIVMDKKPFIAIVDLKLTDMPGSELAEKIKKAQPETKIILLTGDPNLVDFKRCINAGVEGYLTKDADKDIYMEALQTLLNESKYTDKHFAGLLMQMNDERQLTERETEVLRLFAEGKSYKEIADQLNISTRTVETHKKHLHEKLGLTSTTDLVKYAIRHGLIHL
jgi:DNA-binding NarL/FixJ family response regulator